MKSRIESPFRTAHSLYGQTSNDWEPWLREKVLICKSLEDFFRQRNKIGKGRELELLEIHAFRLKAEVELAELIETRNAKP